MISAMKTPVSPALPRILRYTLLIALLGAPALAAASAGERPTLDLQSGDALVFAGDSITHQCLYTQYVEDFFYTRYPERRIRFHNAGVGGDKAADVLARFEDDIAVQRPKYVTVLLGMNDGQYEDFRPEIFATYAADMGRILERIKALGAIPVLLSPTQFDYPVFERRKDDPSYRFRTSPRSPHYNAVLAYYGAWGREQAATRGIPYVNLWGPLNDFTAQERATNPRFTLLPDAIHPGPGNPAARAPRRQRARRHPSRRPVACRSRPQARATQRRREARVVHFQGHGPAVGRSPGGQRRAAEVGLGGRRPSRLRAHQGRT
jgi:lysophospholipase L1-like esterase